MTWFAPSLRVYRRFRAKTLIFIFILFIFWFYYFLLTESIFFKTCFLYRKIEKDVFQVWIIITFLQIHQFWFRFYFTGFLFGSLRAHIEHIRLWIIPFAYVITFLYQIFLVYSRKKYLRIVIIMYNGPFWIKKKLAGLIYTSYKLIWGNPIFNLLTLSALFL